MTGVAMEIKVEGYPLLQRKLGDLARRTSSMRPLMEDIGAYLDFATRRRFTTQIGPDGKRREPSQRALREGGLTLTDTARLKGSFNYHAYDFRVEEGTNVVYAGIHQSGGEIKRKARTQTIYRKTNAAGEISHRFVKKSKSNFATDHAVGDYVINMPARPMVGINDNDEAEITHIVNAYLMRGVA